MIDKLLIFITVFGILFNTIETRPGKQKKEIIVFKFCWQYFPNFIGLLPTDVKNKGDSYAEKEKESSKKNSLSFSTNFKVNDDDSAYDYQYRSGSFSFLSHLLPILKPIFGY